MTRRQFALLLFQIMFTVEFLALDFLMPQYGQVSAVLKFGVVWCAFLFAWPAVTALPLCVTIVCDYLLVFTDYVRLGVALFVLVHVLYIFFLLLPLRRRLASVFMLCLPVICFLFLMPLPVICVFYVAAISLHITTVIFVQKIEPTSDGQPYLFALALFAFCDILTAVYYVTGLAVIAPFIWLFYAPSQIILGVIMSENVSIRWQPVHIKPFHRWGKQSKT